MLLEDREVPGFPFVKWVKIQIISYNESNILKNSSVAKIEALLNGPEIFTEQFCTIKKKKKKLK